MGRGTIKGALFDYGNTLLRYCDFSLEAFADRLREAMGCLLDRMVADGVATGGAPDPEALSEAVWSALLEIEDRARRELFEYDASAEIARTIVGHFKTPPPADLDARVDRALFDIMRRALIPRADAVEMLRALKSRGMRLGLVSNTQFRPSNHLSDLKRDGMLDLLNVTIFSVDLKVRKPRAEIFRAALEALGTPPEATLFVGDSVEHDIAGGRAAGMRTILIRTPDNAAVSDHGADAVVDDLSEIPPLLANGLL